MNYFISKEAAERYAKGRPDFHENTIKHIRAFICPDGKLDKALDVACGTGLSTTALVSIASHVWGTDASTAMLEFARKDDCVQYAVASAENQPFPDNSFDLITVSSGVHWFPIDKFLHEAHRLLKPKSWLAIYENHFIAEMEGNDGFNNWFFNRYLKKYPSPPRHNNYNWDNENLTRKGFNLVREEKFKNPVVFNRHSLALYFTTQSNVISAIEKKETTYQDADEWLNQELEEFFPNAEETGIISFGNWIKFIQKI